MDNRKTAINMLENLIVDYNNIGDSIIKNHKFKEHANDLLGYLCDNFPPEDIDPDIETRKVRDLIYSGDATNVFTDYETMSNVVFVVAVLRHFLRSGINFTKIGLTMGLLPNWKILYNKYGSFVMYFNKIED